MPSDALQLLLKHQITLQKAQSDQKIDDNLVEVFNRWLLSPTADEAKNILRKYPQLLSATVENMHVGLARRQQSEAGRAHILLKRLLLLRRCREVGADQAFEELASGGIGKLPSEAIAGFTVSSDELQSLHEALAARDLARANSLVAASPSLWAFVKLPDTVRSLVKMETMEDTEEFIERHPELVHPMADNILENIASAQTNDAAKTLLEGFRFILARCRQVDVFRAILEARVKFNF